MVAVLPSFPEICGRKMDQGNAVMDWGDVGYFILFYWICLRILLGPRLQEKLDGVDSTQAKEPGPQVREATVQSSCDRLAKPRLYKQIGDSLVTMQQLYKKLESMQAEIAVTRAVKRGCHILILEA